MLFLGKKKPPGNLGYIRRQNEVIGEFEELRYTYFFVYQCMYLTLVILTICSGIYLFIPGWPSFPLLGGAFLFGPFLMNSLNLSF